MITIDESDIAWESDREYNFKNPTGWESISWTDIENGIFLSFLKNILWCGWEQQVRGSWKNCGEEYKVTYPKELIHY